MILVLMTALVAGIYAYIIFPVIPDINLPVFPLFSPGEKDMQMLQELFHDLEYRYTDTRCHVPIIAGRNYTRDATLITTVSD